MDLENIVDRLEYTVALATLAVLVVVMVGSLAAMAFYSATLFGSVWPVIVLGFIGITSVAHKLLKEGYDV